MRDILTETNYNLQELLKNIIDPVNEEFLFDDALIGYDLSNTVSFNKPKAFCYVQAVTEYYNTFGKQNQIKRFESVIGFTIRGIKTDSYNEAIRIANIIHDKFQNDEKFFTINNTVDMTFIKESNVNLIQNNNVFNTGYAFTLEHEILI